jgi:5-methylthioadenosine/S-adenosylhomocysteine deaminase
MSVLVKNGLVLTQNANREVKKGDVYIEDDRIAEIGSVKAEAEDVIDASDKIVMPGFINTHNHVPNTILRGCADDMPLEKMLEKTFSVDAKLTRTDVQIASLLGCIEMLKSGTTSFVDLFYWEDEVAKAVRTSGMRGILGWVLLDEEFTTQKGKPINNCEDFIVKHKNEDRIEPIVSFMGVYVCSEETFMKGRELAERHGTISHLHLSETRKEVYDHQEKYSKRPVEWLDGIGFLHDKVLAAHCCWLTMNEIKILGAKGVKVSHCPVSNMKLASGGVAPIPELLDQNVTVSLGTDSCVSNNDMDMFETMKFASLLQKAHRWDATVLEAQKVVDMATIDGARAIGMDDKLGSIEEGKKADIIVIDLKSPNATPFYDDVIVSHIAYSLNGGNVDTVLVDGEVLMKNRVLTKVDEAKAIEECQKVARTIHGVSG